MKKKPKKIGFFSEEELKKMNEKIDPKTKALIERKKKAEKKARSEATKKVHARRAAKKKRKGLLDQ